MVTKDYVGKLQQEQSLSHEVSYDRSERLASQDEDFTRYSANYRYLIECCLMLDSKSDLIVKDEEMLRVLAQVHWLLNLYTYSDTLHHGIEVGGISIDSSYIPEVYFNENKDIIEKQYKRELASYKLGIGINSNDELISNISHNHYGDINSSFIKDLGFGYRNLCTVLYCLSNWARFNGLSEPSSFYNQKISDLSRMIRSLITSQDVSVGEVETILEFLILDHKKINQLEGVDTPYYDVPISDHNKRTYRLNIRPLIFDEDSHEILWSPACAYRAFGIWTSHIQDGYLPADFNWFHTSAVVDQSKNELEKQLEIKAFDIVKRLTPYIETGVDLKKRFKKDAYPDIGDYDVLAFIPEKNLWIMVECKYNQPAYCLKDMKRLRERIFGVDEESKKSHIFKVNRRYDYLKNNHQKVIDSLKWPNIDNSKPIHIINLYVSKNTYWWFRNPPYTVDVNFVQVDHLGEWLNIHLNDQY